MRQNGHGALTLEDARTWIEETGLCLFLPRRQYSSSIAPSFVEAVAGQQNATPDPKHIQLAEELLVRLELDDVAVRLNLLGQPGEQPDFVVASWVLPYVYALRGDRDWRRSPQLTGSRQVSQLAVQAYKHLEAADTNISDLTHLLGREVTEVAVLRAITELWQQLRIIPVVAAPGVPAKWQLLRHRFQKAIAEGASTSQVTAISVLASIYLQAVIAASMEEVEMFLSPLTARSKVREVLRGLVATRQVHTISMGHAPHFYVAGTLPEFSIAPTLYSSSSMTASYFLLSHDHDDDMLEIEAPKSIYTAPVTPVQTHVDVQLQISAEAHVPAEAPVLAETHAPRPAAVRPAAVRKPASSVKPAAARPHFSRPAAHTRDRKPAQSTSSNRPARRTGPDSRTTPTRTASARPSGARTTTGSRPAGSTRWSANAPAGAKPKLNGNGNHSANGTAHGAKPAAATWGRTGHSTGAKPAGKASATGSRPGSLSRTGSASRPAKDARTDARPARSASRKPALAAGAKAGNAKRYGFTARPKQETKKRG
jgi:hypothetical protein